MSIHRHGLVLIALAASLLGGCASLPKSACQSGAWYDIGLRDGTNGIGEERFLDHAQACAKHGLPADRAQWMAGRDHGLERYCTARNGVAVGERNQRYGGVCPVDDERDFLRGYDVGLDLHQARSRLAWLDGEIQRIGVLIAPPREDGKKDDKDDQRKDGQKDEHKPLTDKERIALAVQLGMHAAERERLRREIPQIEQLAADIASMPER